MVTRNICLMLYHDEVVWKEPRVKTLFSLLRGETSNSSHQIIMLHYFLEGNAVLSSLLISNVHFPMFYQHFRGRNEISLLL